VKFSTSPSFRSSEKALKNFSNFQTQPTRQHLATSEKTEGVEKHGQAYVSSFELSRTHTSRSPLPVFQNTKYYRKKVKRNVKVRHYEGFDWKLEKFFKAFSEERKLGEVENFTFEELEGDDEGITKPNAPNFDEGEIAERCWSAP
jgi:hypothetical protein